MKATGLKWLCVCGLLGLAVSAGQATDCSIVSFHFGGVGLAPIIGDYDGDGKSDPMVYQETSGTWYAALSGQNYAMVSLILGGPGYVSMPGDFDRDGKADPAVYQQASGAGYAALSASGYRVAVFPALGGTGYTPVPADYDGNGQTEMAVYTAQSGDWHLLRFTEPEITDTNVLAILYSNAMVNASNVTASKIYTELTPITENNANLVWRINPDTGAREVLVVSFMKSSIASNYHVGQYSVMKYGDSWVTLVPDVKQVCKAYTGANLLLRRKQVLGLPLTSLNDSIVEFFVDPVYLLRPSRDPEITDQESEVAFRTHTPYAAMVTTNYQGWFQRTIDSRNYGMTNGVWNAWPWTQLGYTYDWSKTDGYIVGLSEYVIPGDMLFNQYGVTAMVYVVTVTGAVNYATAPDNRNVQRRGHTIHIAPLDDR